MRYFLALCEELNFTRAATRCGVRQPSLTRAIKQLEGELGGPLFYRDHGGARLSDLGNLLWPELASIDRSVARAARKAAKFLNARSGNSHCKARRTSMRILSAVVLTIAVLAAGLIFRPIHSATALPPAQAGAMIDPYALQLTIDIRSLPEQDVGELI